MATTENDEGRGKTWKLFSVAVIFAALAGLATVVYLKVLEHRLEKRLSPAQEQMTSVLVAGSNLPIGTEVSTATMAVRKVPSKYVNSDVLTPSQFDSVEGAVLTKPLEQGKMLSQDYIDLNIPKDFSDTIKEGHRAITIQVGEINSISGLIRPGNYIDLYTRIQGGDIAALSAEEGGEVVIPVLEDVFVMATDRRTARPNEEEFRNLQSESRSRTYDTLTIEVTPEDAALISLAESRGSLVAVLRNARDTQGVLFSKVGLGDLVSHSGKLLADARSKLHNKSLAGVHVNDDGKLVTKDGTVINDPNVRMTKEGLLVTKDGTVLSGRGLKVGKDGRIRTRDGKLVDTASLKTGKDGTLIDKNGTVLASNGYRQAKGGFLVDKDGNVITHDGQVLDGLHVGEDGKVRTPDGRVVTADDITVGKDGTVSLKAGGEDGLHVDAQGNVVDKDGKSVKAGDLVAVDKDGVVRGPGGKVLQGVHVGKDGQLYSADGKKMSAGDVLLASKGMKAGKDGTVVDADGTTLEAKDLVSVGADGKVRAKDGRVLEGVYRDADGTLRKKDGSPLTAQDVVKSDEIAANATRQEQKIDGVTAHVDPHFSRTIQQGGTLASAGPAYVGQDYEVEYIVGGGSSDGAATTFMVRVEKSLKPEGETQ